MCDTTGAINGYYTPKDIQNSRIYARFSIMYDRVSKYPNLKWIDTNVDGSPNYNCPLGLTCKDGYVVIENEDECNRMSNETMDVDIEENSDNHYYLEWRSKDGPNSSGKGQCYRGNKRFRKTCETGDFVGDGKTAPVGGLYYDTYSGRCFITPKYCGNIGELKYVSPSDSDPDIPSYLKNKYKNGEPYSIGGVCDMNSGQKVADFIFGETVARGVFGGKCFK